VARHPPCRSDGPEIAERVSEREDLGGHAGIAVTRKNYLFLGSDVGGERAAIIYTLAETAKLNGLDPEAYIAAVLDRLDDLLPWNIRLEAMG
jgi:hypothetical protein